MSAPEPRLFCEDNEEYPDQEMEIWMDGEVIMTVSYYEVGAPAMEKIRALVERIAQEM